MSILPQINVDIGEIVKMQQTAQISVPKEYAWDFNNSDFLLKNGKFQNVQGKEAIKIWIWKALNTEKARFKVYTTGYGNEFENLIDSEYSKNLLESEAKRLAWECISLNQHVLSIENFGIDNSKDVLSISFTAITDQGEVNVSV